MVDTSEPGVVNIAYTLVGQDTDEAPDGEGLLASVRFNTLTPSQGQLSFGYVLFIDSFGEGDVITNTGAATLPVELAAFTAAYVDNYTTKICWTTASETDVIGFNIYRNTEDVSGTATKVNNELIPGHGTTSSFHEYEFLDINPVEFGKVYYYWLESVEHGTNHVYSSIKYVPEEGSGGFADVFDKNILTNYPNPFSGSTTIEYGIKGRLKAEPAEIRIYNVTGQLVETIEAKNGRAVWDASNLATGVYFYQLKTENYNEVKKILLIK
jgi:hypothetical protein